MKVNYDTGWVALTDFTDASETVTHNLGVPLSELIVKFFVSSNNADAGSLEGIDTSRYETDAVGADKDTGVEIVYVSDDAIRIQTGSEGLMMLDTATGAFDVWGAAEVGTGYRVVIYRLK